MLAFLVVRGRFGIMFCGEEQQLLQTEFPPEMLVYILFDLHNGLSSSSHSVPFCTIPILENIRETSSDFTLATNYST
jgi:hypothetical protein